VKRRPGDADAYAGWGEALKEAKEFQKAKEVYEKGLEKTADPRFKALLRELGFLQAPEKPEEDPGRPEQIVPEQHHLVTFTTLFAGREGVYARQWVSPTGESGYTPVEEPLTMKVAENHILGNFTVGTYPVRLDNTVNFVAFDLDLAKFAVRKHITSESAWKSVMHKVHQTACRLMDAAGRRSTKSWSV